MARKPQSRKTARKRGGLRRRKTISKRAVRGGHTDHPDHPDDEKAPSFKELYGIDKRQAIAKNIRDKQENDRKMLENIEAELYGDRTVNGLDRFNIGYGKTANLGDLVEIKRSTNDGKYILFKITGKIGTFMSIPEPKEFEIKGSPKAKYPWVRILNISIDSINNYSINKITNDILNVQDGSINVKNIYNKYKNMHIIVDENDNNTYETYLNNEDIPDTWKTFLEKTKPDKTTD